MKKIKNRWTRPWCVLLTIFLMSLFPRIMKGETNPITFTDPVTGSAVTRTVERIGNEAGTFYDKQTYEYFALNNASMSPENPFVEVDVSTYFDDSWTKGDAVAKHIQLILVTKAESRQLYSATTGNLGAVPSGASFSNQNYGVVVIQNNYSSGDVTHTVFRIYLTDLAVNEGLSQIKVVEMWDKKTVKTSDQVNIDGMTGDVLLNYTEPISIKDDNHPKPTFERTEWNTITMTGNIEKYASHYSDNYFPRYVRFTFGPSQDSAGKTYMSLSSTGNKTGDYKVSDNSYTTNLNNPTSVYFNVYSITDRWPIQSTDGNTYYINSYIPAEGPTQAKVKACPYASNLRTEYNKFTRTTKLDWDGNNTTNGNDYYIDGKWHVFLTRYNVTSSGAYTIKDRKEVATLALGINTYNHQLSKSDYDMDVTYDVVFMRDSWKYTATSPTFEEVKSLGMQSAHISTMRSYSLNIEQDKTDSTAITIKWNYEEVIGENKPKVIIERRINQDGAWSGITALNALTANNPGANQSGNKYTDTEATSVCDDYYYRISITAMDSTWTKEIGPVFPVNGTYLTKLSVSKGTYNNIAKATWTVKQRGVSDTHYVLLRRLLGSTDNADWKEIHSEQGTKDTYMYEDNTAQPGQYYEYRVDCYSRMCENKTSTPTSLTDVGFSANAGIISGRITYGTGTAVANARVTIVKGSDNGSGRRQFSALKVNGLGSRLVWRPSASQITNLFNGTNPFTIQLWVNPNSNITNTGGAVTSSGTGYSEPRVLEICDNIKLNLIRRDDNSYTLKLYGNPGSGQIGMAACTDLIVPAGQYTNVAITFDGKQWSLRKIQGDSVFVSAYKSADACNMTKEALRAVSLGGTMENDVDANARFIGYIDDVRIWNKVLTDKDMLSNYDRLLVGSETGLLAYWPLDEQLDNYAFDVSSSNGVSNENHATPEMCNTDANVPDKLSLYALTDVDGNYVIRGIRYTDGGTNYNVIPTLGIHSFSPTKDSRYISQNSLNFSSVNFSDISSFPVSGTVYYANTNYPVKGVNFYVDGQVCTKDGDLIKSADDGSYTISVPIGDHYVEAKMNNHSFTDNGRYPADPKKLGTKVTYINKVVNLDFYDNTLVTVAGRICGGNIEHDKVLGFNQSTCNIGKAKIILTPTDTRYNLNWKITKEGTVVNSSAGTERLAVPTPSSYVTCEAYRDSGKYARNIVIFTNSKSGEFAVSVPPLNYTADVSIPSNDTIAIAKQVVNATDPSLITTDSIDFGDGTETFDYVAAFRPEYHSPTFFSVTDESHNDGAYGEASYTFYDKSKPGVVDVKDIYSVSNGVVKYKYGGPIFVQGTKYVFKLKGYENYANYDIKSAPVYTTVPLANALVKASNGLSSEQFVVYKDSADLKAGRLYKEIYDYITLDSLGECEYAWEAGMPDIIEPYTGRGFNFTYSVNQKWINWQTNAQVGIILGCLPTGTNFVTGGPSIVEMILRDPPGSASSATWTKGMTVSNSHEISNKLENKEEGSTVSHLGNTEQVFVGVGAGTISEIGVKQDLTVGAELNIEKGWNNSFTTTVKTETGFSTSDKPEYVGEQGDLFVGEATNITYGKARKLDFIRNGSSFTLHLDNAITSGLSFATTFAYPVNYIEQTLIPNLIANRNSLLIHTDNVDCYPSQPGKALYVTALTENDVKFGADSTYRFVVPTSLPNDSILCDSVMWYNMQIRAWKTAMMNNEIAKITAKENRTKWLDKNYSFTTGGSISSSVSNDIVSKTEEPLDITASVVIGYGTGVTINKTGVDVEVKTTNGYHRTENNITETTESQTTSFTLAANGDDDALSVDVFKAPDNKGPIFITRGGQTSCPYQPATYTRYYKPGTKLDEATMQIEQPHIFINKVKNATATNVANGSKATFRVVLTNTSEIGENSYYDLFIAPKSNPYGANISIEGQSLLNGTTVLVNAGDSVVKLLTLSQTDLSKLEYDSIGIVIASQCQRDPTSTWETITDTAYISAQFVASSSPVTLKIPTTTLNSLTGATLMASINGYDLDYNNFKALRLQYKYANNADWITMKEYKTAAYMKEGDVQIPAEGITIKEDLSSYSDGLYQFRVASVSMSGNDETYYYTDVINVTKDMASPSIIGNARPSDGVLSAGDDISVTFNEDIQKDKLTKSANFLITGTLNGADIDNAVGLRIDGNDNTAYTEADISLAGKNFAIESWLRPESKGTFFTHGKASNKMRFGLDASQHFVVSIGGNDYVSTEALPLNKWQYLSVSYNASSATIDAYAFYDATTVHLFDNVKAAPYSGQGVITLGGDFHGAMHELTLWDDVRSLTQTSTQMNVTKNPLQQGLIGYWKLDEGSGKMAADAARHRNMLLPAESWYLNNVNKDVTLNGSQALLMPMTSIVPSDNDNYAIELWFKGDISKQGSGQPALFSAEGNSKMTMMFNASGQLSLVQGTDVIQLNQTNYLDNVWHHLAMNVLRQGNASFYVDGTLIKQTSAANVKTPQCANLIIGASGDGTGTGYTGFFNGSIDEIRFWNATLNAIVLNNNRTNRLSGSEAGLVAYYPFEKKALDSGNQVVTEASTEDRTASDSSITSTAGTIAFADDAPALKDKNTETNLDFTFVSDERNIVIKLNNSPAEIEGCTVNFVVKDVADYNGNVSSPIRWSAYVKQNQLLWTENEVTVEQQVGQTSSFEATISNSSGESAAWSITGIPSWITPSMTEGTLEPLASKKITFSVSSSAPVGKYEQTIYLVGDNNIYEPLTVNAKITAKRPDWNVNSADYGNSMSMIGTLKFQNVYSTNEEDIIAAFNGDECVGVASPQYNSKYDSYIVFLDVYGNDSDIGDNITFKAWNANTGIIYPVVSTSSNVIFQSDLIIGSVNDLFVWNGENKMEQQMNLVKGWNWISFYVNRESKDPNDIFKNQLNNIVNVKSRSQFAVPKDGQLKGTLNDMPVEYSYMLQASSDFNMSITGDAINIAATPITLNKGWTWIGYIPSFSCFVDDALAGASPQKGDVIKNRNGFAQFDGTQWLGSLKYMNPGLGYKYMNITDANKSFTYPSAPNTSKIRSYAPSANTWKRHFSEGDVSSFADNATFILTLTVNGVAVQKDVDIATFDANGLCCGISDVDPDDPGVFYMVAFANTNDKLTYHLWINGKEVTTSLSFPFVTNAIVRDTIDVTPYVDVMNENDDYVTPTLTDVSCGYFALNRTFEAGKWNTFIIPFSLDAQQIKEVFGNDAAVRIYSECKQNGVATELEFTNSETIAANTPCLIKIGAASADNKYYFREMIPEISNILTVTNGGLEFVGNYNGETGKIAAGDYYIVDNTINKATKEVNLQGFRAYLHDTNVPALQNISINIESDASGIIETLSEQGGFANGNIYNLDGSIVRKGTDTNGLKPGVYIVNGKKVVIKWNSSDNN